MGASIEATGKSWRVLIIETSGRAGQVALARSADLVGVRRLDEARRHARDLAPQTLALLGQQGWSAHDLDAVVVSLGPGSYTGLRVGIMSAKTLAYALGCTLLGIETFAAIALQAPADVGTVDVIADAQQERVYVQRFHVAPGVLPSPETPLRIVTLHEWLGERPVETFVTGPGLHVYRSAVADRVVESQFWDPQPVSLLQLGRARIERGESDDVWKIEPLYLRPSGAEEKWAKARGEK
jgi:tRNA threonylcarbamoyladenosine biosynthesis protein TsaB